MIQRHIVKALPSFFVVWKCLSVGVQCSEHSGVRMCSFSAIGEWGGFRAGKAASDGMKTPERLRRPCTSQASLAFH